MTSIQIVRRATRPGSRLAACLEREVTVALLPAGRGDEQTVANSDIAELPAAITRFEIHERAFDVTITAIGLSVIGGGFIDERGRPVDFRRTKPPAALSDWLRRAERRTPISGPFAVARALLERDPPRVKDRVDPVEIAFTVATGR